MLIEASDSSTNAGAVFRKNEQHLQSITLISPVSRARSRRELFTKSFDNRCTSDDHPRSPRRGAIFEASLHFRTGVVNPVLGLESIDCGNRIAQAARSCFVGGTGEAITGARR